MSENRLPDYIDHILNVVWDTVQEALPELLKQLPTVRQDAGDENYSNSDVKL